MGVLTRRRIKQNLNEVDVFVDDLKNEYFAIQDIPDTFTQGRSAFKIFGSPLLKETVPLKIEILDKAGNTVYVQPVKYGQGETPKLPYRYVSVEVYPPPINVPGEAKLVILGELEENETPFEIPPRFINTYNVKFTKTINIDTFTIKNTQPILFYKKPTVSTQEVVVAQRKLNPDPTNYISGSNIYGKVKQDLKSKPYATGSNTNTKEDDTSGGGKSDSSDGDIKTELELWKYKTGLYGKRAVLAKRGIKARKASAEPPQMTIFSVDANSFNTKMAGGTIEIGDINLPAARKRTLSGMGDYDKTITDDTISNMFTFPRYTARIETVVSDRELTTTKPYSHFYNGPNAPAEGVKYYSDIGSSKVADDLYANFTASYVDWAVPSTSSYRFDSFVDVKIKNMRTFSGDVYRLKVYGASDSSQGDFPVILETIVESPELLRDTTSPSGFLRSGYFIDQTHTDLYWNSYGGDGVDSGLNPVATMSLADGIYLSGSYVAHNQAGRFELKPDYAFTVEKDTAYTLSFNAKGKRSSKTNIDGDTYKDAKIFFHLSGSNLSSDNKLKIQTSGSFGHTITNIDNKSVGLQIDDKNQPQNDGFVNFGYVGHTFTPKFNLDRTTNTDTTLQFRIEAGEWIISDVSLRPAQDTGFSPDEMEIRVPIAPNTQRPDNFDFLIEYYDIDGKTAEAVTFINNVPISGSQLVIEGEDNMLSGSLFLGNIQGSGIEIHGGSAYMRSVGYEGFTSASVGGKGGFMIWSGSVLPDAPETYTGAGLEIHDGTISGDQSFFKFRTVDPENANNSSFEVRSSKFFFGSETSGNFVSGSLGNIEISSSNFHITPEGDITASNFNLNSGTIQAGVTVLGTVTANSIAVPAGGTTLAEITSLGFARFVSASIGGFDIDNTSIGKSPIFQLSSSTNTKDPVSFISSSEFKVSADGRITSSAGQIAGWEITDNYINKPLTGHSNTATSRIYLSVAEDDTQNIQQGLHIYRDDDDTSAGEVKIIRVGQLSNLTNLHATGSNDYGFQIIKNKTSNTYENLVYFGKTQQQISGFEILADEIKDLGGNLRLKSSGQITGSFALLDGGRIAGFDIVGNTLQSTNARMTMSAVAGAEHLSIRNSSLVEKVRIGEISAAASDKYGIKIFDDTNIADNDDGNGQVVLLGELGNMIGGWEINDNQIRSVPNAGLGGQYSEAETGLILQSRGVIETSDFATGLKGWRISSLGNGTAEFENARIRGTLRTTVFEKESINVVGGQLMVANSSTLEPLRDASGSILVGVPSASATDVTMSMANVSGFSPGEILKAKKVDDTGFIVEYLQVTGSMRYTDTGSPYSASISAANMGANDPDGLAGELYVGRGYGGSFATSSIATTLDGGINSSVTAITVDSVAAFGSGSGIDSIYQEIIKIGNERMKVITGSAATKTLQVIRDYHGTEAASHSDGANVQLIDTDIEFLAGLVSTAQPYDEGQVFVSTGKFDAAEEVSSGYILMNANPNDISTPYMDIVERTGSDVYALQLRSRIGDLSGLSSGYLYGEEEPGFGIYTDNGFFRGAITAMTGSIKGRLYVNTSAAEEMILGRDVSGTNDGMYINSNNYWYTTGLMKVGTSDRFMQWDGANLTVQGKVIITSGPSATQLAALNTKTGSLDSSTSALGAKSASLDAATSALGVATASLNTRTGSLDTLETRVEIDSAGMALKNSAGVTLADYSSDITMRGGTITLNGTTGTVGHDRLVLGSAEVSMYTNNYRRFYINDSVVAIGNNGNNDISTTTEDNVVRIDGTRITIFNDGNNFASMSAGGLNVTQGGSTKADIGSDITLNGGTITLNGTAGSLGHDRLVLGSAEVSLYSNNYRRFHLDDTALAIGSNGNNSISTSTTDNVLKLNSNELLFLKDLNNFVSMSATGFNIVQGGVSRINAGNMGGMGTGLVLNHNQHERLEMLNDIVDMYVGGYRKVRLSDGVLSLGAPDGASVTHTSTDQAVRINSTGVQIYYDDDYKAVLNSGGMDVYQDGNKVAIFGATTVLGSSGGAVTTTSTNDCVRITNSGVSIFQDTNNKAVVNSSGLTVTQGGNTAAVFAGTTVIGETGSGKSNISLSNDSIKLRQGSTDIVEISGSGDIVSNDYLIERSRLFGFGGDGTITLAAGTCTVADGGNGAGTESISNEQIKDANGTVVCERVSTTWNMKSDWYTYDFTLNSGRLVTAGFRLFVFGTLTIASGAIISNNGSGGTIGQAGFEGAGGGEGGAGGGLAVAHYHKGKLAEMVEMVVLQLVQVLNLELVVAELVEMVEQYLYLQE